MRADLSACPPAPATEISVVIAAYNEERHIGRCLTSVLSQIPPAQVVVVDDASRDRTAAIAEGLGADVLRLPSRTGRGGARDAGARAARGSIIAFVDADDEVMPGWLAGILRAFDAGAEVVAGAITVGPQDSFARRFRARNREDEHDLEARNGFLPRLITANVAVRKDVLLDAGGFDAAIRAGEDTDLSWRLALRGRRFTRAPDAVVRFTPPRSVAGLLRREIRRGFHAASLAWRYQSFEFPLIWARRPSAPVRAAVFKAIAAGVGGNRPRREAVADSILGEVMQTAARLSFRIGYAGLLFGLRSPPPTVTPSDASARSAARPLTPAAVALVGASPQEAWPLGLLLNAVKDTSAAPPGLGREAAARWEAEAPWALRIVRDAAAWRLHTILAAKRLERARPRTWGESYVALHAIRAWLRGKSVFVIVEEGETAAALASHLPAVPYLPISSSLDDALEQLEELIPGFSARTARSCLPILRRVPRALLRVIPT